MTGLSTIRLFFALEALGWGLVLLLPGDTFGLSRSLAGLAAMMDEWQWALVFGGEGLLILACFRSPAWFRLLISLLVCLGHGGLAASFGRSSGMLSLGSVTHLVAAFTLAAWMLGEDALAFRQARRHRG